MYRCLLKQDKWSTYGSACEKTVVDEASSRVRVNGVEEANSRICLSAVSPSLSEADNNKRNYLWTKVQE